MTVTSTCLVDDCLNDLAHAVPVPALRVDPVNQLCQLDLVLVCKLLGLAIDHAVDPSVELCQRLLVHYSSLVGICLIEHLKDLT
jgi:hypothetical protein